MTLATALAIWATHSLNARAETSLAQQRSVAQVAPELKQPLPSIAPATASQALPDSQLLGHILERKKQFAKIDALAEHGQLTELPPPSESIIGDAGGLRSDLAEHGIGFNILSMSTFTNNYKHHGRHRPQAYIGERPTYSSNLVAGFTYDLGRLGLDNGQFIFGVGSYYSSWDEVNPSSPFNFTRIAYYQSLWDKTVEIKIGVLPNDLEYIGPFTGGTLVGGTQGLQAVIPYQVGLSHAPVSSPAANLTLNLGNFYNKFGVQRSISPDGMGAEIDRHLGELDLHADHAGALYIDELGYKRAATPGTPYAWLRAGYIYNTSDYTRFLSNERSDDNHAGYLLQRRRQYQARPPPRLQRRRFEVDHARLQHAPGCRYLLPHWPELRGKAGLQSRRERCAEPAGQPHAVLLIEVTHDRRPIAHSRDLSQWQPGEASRAPPARRRPSCAGVCAQQRFRRHPAQVGCTGGAGGRSRQSGFHP